MTDVDTSPEAVERLAAQADLLAREDAAPIYDGRVAATLRALAAENAKLRAALETAKAAITDRDGLNEFAIQDTIWADKTETLLDHIDAALRARAEEAPHE